MKVILDLESDRKDQARQFLDWIFQGQNPEDPEDHMAFDRIVTLLDGDPDEARLRLQSYLYRYWRVVDEPLGGVLAKPPPSAVLASCVYHCGFGADDCARVIWYQPGITPRTVLDRLTGSNPLVADTDWPIILEKLLDQRLVLEQGTNLYLVGHYGYRLEKRSH